MRNIYKVTLNAYIFSIRLNKITNHIYSVDFPLNTDALSIDRASSTESEKGIDCLLPNTVHEICLFRPESRHVSLYCE